MRRSSTLLLLAALAPSLHAATWYNLTDSVAGANDWNGQFSWFPDAPPNAPGAVAIFSTQNYSVANEVFFNGSRTVGRISFGDTTAPIVQTLLSPGSPSNGVLTLNNNGTGALIETISSTSSPPLNNEFPIPKAANEIRVPVVLSDNLTCTIRTAPSVTTATRWPGVVFTREVTESGSPRSITVDGVARGMTVFSAGASHTGGTLVKTGSLGYGSAGSFGTGPITVLSTGQFVISNARTVTNSFTIAGNGVPESDGDRGALFFGNGTTVVSGPITLTAAARIEGTRRSLAQLTGTLTGTNDLEFNALVTPNANEPRIGDFDLLGNASGFTGKLKISRGDFTLGPASNPGGAMDVSRSATLSGETTLGGTLKLGTATPDAGTAAILHVDTLTPGALHTAGNLELSGAVKVQLHGLPPGPVVKVASYGGSLVGSLANLDLVGGMSAYRAGTAFDTTAVPGEVLLNVTRGSITWTGGTASWDTAGTTWAGGETFHFLDDVTFDDTSAGGGTVIISGDLQPGVIRVNNSPGNDYILDGDNGGEANPLQNSIATGRLVKDGAGTLTIGISTASSHNEHTFTGGTTINAGTVAVRQNGDPALRHGPLGSGPVVMNGGTLHAISSLPIALYNPVTINNSVTLGSASSSGQFFLSSLVTLGSSITLTIPASVTLGKGNDAATGLTDAGAGHSLTKTGSGTLDFSAASVSSLGGTVSLQQGGIRARGTLTAAALTAASGTTLSGSGTVNAPVTIAPGATITAANDSTNVLAVTFTFGSSVEIDGTFSADITETTSDRISVAGALDISSAALVLNILETPQAPAYILASYGSVTGAQFASVTGVPYGYRLVYGYNDGASSNNIALVAIPPYELWAAARGLTAGLNDEPDADPDKDGLTNREHYAFDSDPLAGSGDPASGRIKLELATAGGADKYLTVTLPVRKNAVFSGTPLAAVKDGVRYEIHGSTALAAPFSLSAVEILPARSAGMPALTTDTDTTAGPDYEYRTFRLQQPQSALGRAFLTPVAVSP